MSSAAGAAGAGTGAASAGAAVAVRRAALRRRIEEGLMSIERVFRALNAKLGDKDVRKMEVPKQ